MSHSKTHGVWWIPAKHGCTILCGDTHVEGSSSCKEHSTNYNQLHPPPSHCWSSVDANSTHILHFWTSTHQVRRKSVSLAATCPRCQSNIIVWPKSDFGHFKTESKVYLFSLQCYKREIPHQGGCLTLKPMEYGWFPRSTAVRYSAVTHMWRAVQAARIVPLTSTNFTYHHCIAYA